MNQPEKNLIPNRILHCLEKAMNQKLESIDSRKHLFYDYGLDSLGYQKFHICLEQEFSIDIPEDESRSGFFASLEGVEAYLLEYHGLGYD
jgi:acyl carrier protein